MTHLVAARTATGAVAALLAAGNRAGVIPWKLVRLLGEGQYTRVFAARPLEAAEDSAAAYAVKVPQPGYENDPRVLGCLRREALVSRAVPHPRLISILTAQLHEPPYFLVMPKLAGARLDRLLAHRRLSLPMSLCIVRQVAEALAALHASGWMHADVKPANVFISRTGHATLLDLGFARRRDEWATAPKELRGSAAYLAPEAFVSSLAPDIRSDLYSLGVMLFELLAGQRPFAEKDPAEIAKRHLTSPPPTIRSLVPHVPSEVARLLEELLAKEPLRRPETPRELIDRLVALEILTFSDRQL
jgi:serine/threonine protein kinase